MRCMPSSGRTARARPPPSVSCWGCCKADAGEVSLLGGDPWRDAVELHRRLAYVPGDVTLWPSLTGGEIIDLLGRLRGGIDASRRRALTERFDLDTSKKARAYSRGNRQKVALIAALASRAELLLLDEPTAGLDPLMEATFRECVNDERHDGRTILLSSHILAEAEALADRVTIIRDGRAVETGTLAEMRHLATDLSRGRARRAGRARAGWRACTSWPSPGPWCAARWTAPPLMRCSAACTRPASGL